MADVPNDPAMGSGAARVGVGVGGIKEKHKPRWHASSKYCWATGSLSRVRVQGCRVDVGA
jgi:hypothetical protein